MRTEPPGVDRATRGGSWMWLVLVPTLCALFTWFLSGVGPVADAILATLGLLSVLGYGLRTRTLRHLWPLLPFAAGAVTLVATSLIIWANIDRFNALEPTEWFGTVLFLDACSFILLPILAFVGGLVCVRPARPRGIATAGPVGPVTRTTRQ